MEGVEILKEAMRIGQEKGLFCQSRGWRNDSRFNGFLHRLKV